MSWLDDLEDEAKKKAQDTLDSFIQAMSGPAHGIESGVVNDYNNIRSGDASGAAVGIVSNFLNTIGSGYKYVGLPASGLLLKSLAKVDQSPVENWYEAAHNAINRAIPIGPGSVVTPEQRQQQLKQDQQILQAPSYTAATNAAFAGHPYQEMAFTQLFDPLNYLGGIADVGKGISKVGGVDKTAQAARAAKDVEAAQQAADTANAARGAANEAVQNFTQNGSRGAVTTASINAAKKTKEADDAAQLLERSRQALLDAEQAKAAAPGASRTARAIGYTGYGLQRAAGGIEAIQAAPFKLLGKGASATGDLLGQTRAGRYLADSATTQARNATRLTGQYLQDRDLWNRMQAFRNLVEQNSQEPIPMGAPRLNPDEAPGFRGGPTTPPDNGPVSPIYRRATGYRGPQVPLSEMSLHPDTLPLIEGGSGINDLAAKRYTPASEITPPVVRDDGSIEPPDVLLPYKVGPASKQKDVLEAWDSGKAKNAQRPQTLKEMMTATPAEQQAWQANLPIPEGAEGGTTYRLQQVKVMLQGNAERQVPQDLRFGPDIAKGTYKSSTDIPNEVAQQTLDQMTNPDLSAWDQRWMSVAPKMRNLLGKDSLLPVARRISGEGYSKAADNTLRAYNEAMQGYIDALIEQNPANPTLKQWFDVVSRDAPEYTKRDRALNQLRRQQGQEVKIPETTPPAQQPTLGPAVEPNLRQGTQPRVTQTAPGTNPLLQPVTTNPWRPEPDFSQSLGYGEDATQALPPPSGNPLSRTAPPLTDEEAQLFQQAGLGSEPPGGNGGQPPPPEEPVTSPSPAPKGPPTASFEDIVDPEARAAWEQVKTGSGFQKAKKAQMEAHTESEALIDSLSAKTGQSADWLRATGEQDPEKLASLFEQAGMRDEADSIRQIASQYGIGNSPRATEYLRNAAWGQIQSDFGLNNKQGKLLSAYRGILRVQRKLALLNPRYIAGNTLDDATRYLLGGGDPRLHPVAQKVARVFKLDTLTPEGVAAQLETDMPVGLDSNDLHASNFHQNLDSLAQDTGVNLNQSAGSYVKRGAFAQLVQHWAHASEQSFRKAAWATGTLKYLASDAVPDFQRALTDKLGAEDAKQLTGVLQQATQDSDGLLSANALGQAVKDATGRDDLAQNAAAYWQREINKSYQAGMKLQNGIYFDYGKRTNLDELAGDTLMFHFWATRNLPFYNKVFSENPQFFRYLAQYEQTNAQQNKQNGLTFRFAGKSLSIPIPFLFGGSQLEINPVSPLFSVYGQMPSYLSSNQSNLQNALSILQGVGATPTAPVQAALEATLGRVGEYPHSTFSFLRPTPIIQDITASLGANHGNGVNVEQPLDKLIGRPQEDAIRDYDIYKRIQELAYENTGNPHDPTFMTAYGEPNSPIYQEAQKEVNQAALAQNVLSMLLPASTTLASNTELAGRKAAQPYKGQILDPNDLAVTNTMLAGLYRSLPGSTKEAQIDSANAIRGQYSANAWKLPEVKQAVYGAFPDYADFMNFAASHPELNSPLRVYLGQPDTAGTALVNQRVQTLGQLGVSGEQITNWLQQHHLYNVNSLTPEQLQSMYHDLTQSNQAQTMLRFLNAISQGQAAPAQAPAAP